MRIIYLLLAWVLMGAGFPAQQQNKWIIDSSSRLLIRGNTNVNSFTCSIDSYQSGDTLEYQINQRSCDLVFLRNEMVIPVEDFSCGNEMITKDFWQTLNSDRHPNLKIRFISLNNFDDPATSSKVSGRVTITLSGVTRSFNITYTIQSNKGRIFSMVGKQVVCFSDFELKPPKKMMGLIQVQEDLEVEFHLNIIPV